MMTMIMMMMMMMIVVVVSVVLSCASEGGQNTLPASPTNCTPTTPFLSSSSSSSSSSFSFFFFVLQYSGFCSFVFLPVVFLFALVLVCVSRGCCLLFLPLPIFPFFRFSFVALFLFSVLFALSLFLPILRLLLRYSD